MILTPFPWAMTAVSKPRASGDDPTLYDQARAAVP